MKSNLYRKCKKKCRYEPTLKEKEFNGCKVIESFEEFSTMSDVILANRIDDKLFSVKDKIYTRDLYSRD